MNVLGVLELFLRACISAEKKSALHKGPACFFAWEINCGINVFCIAVGRFRGELSSNRILDGSNLYAEISFSKLREKNCALLLHVVDPQRFS